MDGWMDGWKDGWTDGRMERWMERWKGDPIDLREPIAYVWAYVVQVQGVQDVQVGRKHIRYDVFTLIFMRERMCVYVCV